jgi:hypothetical protein
VVTGQLVVGDELLAHVQQHVVELRWILCHRRGHLSHALPGVGVGQRHQTRHGADQAIDHTELEVGVHRDAVGEGVSEFIAEGGDEDRPYPLLEVIQQLAEGFGEVTEKSDDSLDFVLEVLQDRADVGGDLAQDVVSLAGEQTRDRVHQTVQGDPVQEAADGVLSLLHAVGEFIDLGRVLRRIFRQLRQPIVYAAKGLLDLSALGDL